MRVAERVVKNGVTAGEQFKRAVRNLILTQNISKVIETGTYHGLGTTSTILEALKYKGKPFTFISIEVNPAYHSQAIRNIGNQPGVYLLNGLSVGKENLPKKEDIRFDDYPDEVIVDHEDPDRVARYISETEFDVRDHQLNDALNYFHFKPDLVLLDSAGHMGKIEFDYLMERVKSPFFLALDDIQHVKHYKTYLTIKGDERFQVFMRSGEKFGSCLARFSGGVAV